MFGIWYECEGESSTWCELDGGTVYTVYSTMQAAQEAADNCAAEQLWGAEKFGWTQRPTFTARELPTDLLHGEPLDSHAKCRAHILPPRK